MKKAGISSLILVIGLLFVCLSCEGGGDENGRDDDTDDDASGDDDTDDDTNYTPEGNVLKIYDPDAGTATATYNDTDYEGDFNSGAFNIEYIFYWSSEELPSSGYAGFSFQFLREVDKDQDIAFTVDAYRYEGGEPHIEATNNGFGNFENCVEPISYDTWHKVTILVDPSATTYDVLVDEKDTRCHDLLIPDGPLSSLLFAVYGNFDVEHPSQLNIAYVDSFLITKEKATIFEEDWEAHTVGSPPGDPWVYNESPNAYMEIYNWE